MFSSNMQTQYLYEQTCNQPWLTRMWLALSGRRSRLLDLTDVLATGPISGQRFLGLQWVSLDQIRSSGSQARCND